MKLTRTLMALALTASSTTANAQSEPTWTLSKEIRLTQTQKVGGDALYVATEGSWFPAGHRCEEKSWVLITAGDGQTGFDQVFSQVMMAHATGKKVQFLTYTDDCDLSSGSDNPYYRADFVQVAN